MFRAGARRDARSERNFTFDVAAETHRPRFNCLPNPRHLTSSDSAGGLQPEASRFDAGTGPALSWRPAEATFRILAKSERKRNSEARRNRGE